jgi:hypothetical protein
MARLLLKHAAARHLSGIRHPKLGDSMARAVQVVLVIFALIGPVYAGEKAPENNLTGVYACEGTNPDGATYSGVVEIVRIKDTYLVRWTMPNDSQVVGVGILSGGQLSVSYYGGTPSLVVYSVGENGQLNGKWTAGGAEGLQFSETLTRLPEGTPRPAKPAKPSKPTHRESDEGPRIKV